MEHKLLAKKTFLYYKYSSLLYDSKVTSSPSVQFFETANSKIWVINPNYTALDLSLLEKLDNVKYSVHEINGIWACIIQDKINNSFRVITSINNEQPWYYLNSKIPAVANNIFLLRPYIQEVKRQLQSNKFIFVF